MATKKVVPAGIRKAFRGNNYLDKTHIVPRDTRLTITTDEGMRRGFAVEITETVRTIEMVEYVPSGNSQFGPVGTIRVVREKKLVKS